MPRTPTAVLMCGLTASGKTTYAKQLETDHGYVRLSVDEQVHALHGRYGIDYPEDTYFEREGPVVQAVRDRLVALLHEGRDVALDQGLWRRADRGAYKTLVIDAGGQWRLLYFPVDRDELLRRLAIRNQRDDGNALTVTPSALDDFIARFDEPDGEDEDIIRPS